MKLPLFQSSLQSCSPRKMHCNREANTQENNNAEAQSQSRAFAASLN